MKADEILKKHEDANEMHFHEVDRKWIIEAMEEYAALRQPLVSGSVCDECGDGSGWYGDDIEPEYGSITMNCSKCNPEAN